MGATTSTSLLQRGIASNTVCNKTNDYQIVLGSINGLELPNTNIKNFLLSEDIFSLLPTLCFDMVDAGSFFDSGDMYVGQTIYAQFAPMRMFNKETKITTYSSMRMKIVSIINMHSNTDATTVYHITCVYDALGIMGGVYPYPPKSNVPIADNAATESSVNAIKAQLNAGGIDATADVSTTDSMIWINTRNKIYQAVNKFLNHSWVSEEDALLAYTSFVNDKTFNDKSNTDEIEAAFTKHATITSCNTLKLKSSEATYIPSKLKGEHANCFRFANATVKNRAGITTIVNDAYKQVEYTYDPLGILNEAEMFDFEVADDVIPKGLTQQKIIFGMLKRTFDNPEVTMAANGSKIDTLYNYTNKITDCGIHFPNTTHAYYDVAPAHNKAVLASFFNTAIDIVFDVNQQSEEVLQSNALPYIGQKVTLDCSFADEEISENYSGDYIVAQIKYNIYNNEPALCVLTLIADGTYKKPTLTT